MKKVLYFFIVVILGNTIQIGAQIDAFEMQLFGGFEFGLGVFKVNSDVAYSDGNSPIALGDLLNEDTASAFFASGFTFGLRLFYDDSPIGFIFRDRAIFITDVKQTGRASINGDSFWVSETYSTNDDFIISIMDFDPGVSVRYKLSDRFQFYTDLGINFTIMDSEDYDSGEKLNYWGFGIYSALALQMNLTQQLYLELGINAIHNILSSQKGEFINRYNGKIVKYEDAGRFDLSTVAAYLTIGWRLNIERPKEIK
ncbi:hypothetical protein ACYULU_02440 [Breznakiellaceae bacterium SP9]